MRGSLNELSAETQKLNLVGSQPGAWGVSTGNRGSKSCFVRTRARAKFLILTFQNRLSPVTIPKGTWSIWVHPEKRFGFTWGPQNLCVARRAVVSLRPQRRLVWCPSQQALGPFGSIPRSALVHLARRPLRAPKAYLAIDEHCDCKVHFGPSKLVKSNYNN